MGFLLNIIVTLGIAAQFLLDHIVKKKDLKIRVGLVILFCTLIGLWGAYVLQDRESTQHSNTLDTLKAQNIELKGGLFSRDSNIIRIRSQNDFLIEQMIEIKKRQGEFNILARDIQEANRIREVREASGDKAVARSVTPDLARRMTSILTTHRGSKLTLTCVLGDQESFQFANELKQIFRDAGWDVNGVDQALYAQPILGVFVKVKSQQYPRRVDAIVEAFKVLNIKLEGFFDQNFGTDDVELIVGGRQ